MSNDAGNNPGDPHDGAEDGEDRTPRNPFQGTPFEQIFASFGTGSMPDLGGMDLGALMGQMQALMQPYDGPVNWPLAIDIARRTSAQEHDPRPDSAAPGRVADAFRL